MILLDTDHVTVYSDARNAAYSLLKTRLETSGDPIIATTIITVEEHLRGWLARLRRHEDIQRQIPTYDRLATAFDFFRNWHIIRLDALAGEEFNRLQKLRIRIGTMDLKIAAITLTQDALLLSANLRDFRRVPGLRVENWLEGSS